MNALAAARTSNSYISINHQSADRRKK